MPDRSKGLEVDVTHGGDSLRRFSPTDAVPAEEDNRGTHYDSIRLQLKRMAVYIQRHTTSTILHKCMYIYFYSIDFCSLCKIYKMAEDD